MFDIRKTKPSTLIKFIKDSTTYSLNLPHHAYVPEDMLDEFYEDQAEGLEIFEDDYLYKVELEDIA